MNLVWIFLKRKVGGVGKGRSCDLSSMWFVREFPSLALFSSLL